MLSPKYKGSPILYHVLRTTQNRNPVSEPYIIPAEAQLPHSHNPSDMTEEWELSPMRAPPPRFQSVAATEKLLEAEAAARWPEAGFEHIDSGYAHPPSNIEPDLEAKLQGDPLTVTLRKSFYGLGFTVIGGDRPGELLQIKNILPGGMVDKDGRLHVGDMFVRINGISVLSYSHRKLMALFKEIPPNTDVQIEIRRGYPLPGQDEPPAVISDERAQKLIDEALGKGSLKQRDVVSTLTGLTGSGKTWLLSRLFGKDPPDLYTSTGIAEKSERGLFHHIGNVSFKLLSDKDILEFLAPLIQAGMTEANVVSLAIDLLSMDASEATTSTPPRTLPSSSFKPRSMPKESPTSQEMVRLVKEANISKKEMVLELIHMIDTGGQPEFMERMPCLIHNANLAVLVVNLLCNLDERPSVRFHVKGVAYKREMPPQYSTRQMIRKLAVTLQAKRSSQKNGNLFQILVVATHRDCVKGDLKARINALNQELRDSLLPTYRDKLLMYSTDQIAFVLNLKDPDDDDEKALEMIRSKVSDKARALGKVIDIPGSFFMYEQDLLKYAAKEKRGVLSWKECLDVGARLKMEDEVVQAALLFFHRNNTFLYFRKVLPNLVFVKPQVPLDFVNAVVLFSYKISDGCTHGILVHIADSLKNGIITEEMLSCDEFSACFVPGLYGPHQAIELSCHTFTLAPLSRKKWSEPSTKSPQPTAVADGKKDQYLMMCLLPPIPDEELCQYIPSSSKMIPLVVKFTDDCVPLGCFGSIISCLLSWYDWEVNSKEDDSPECLYRNIASLFCPTLYLKVVLVDTADHIEVYVDEDANCHDLPDVRKEIFGAIRKVFDIMHITDSEIEVSPAFLCPCKKVRQPHMASLGEVKSQKYLLCSKKKWKGKPQDKYTVWLDDKSSQASACGKLIITCALICSSLNHGLCCLCILHHLTPAPVEPWSVKLCDL